MILKSKTNNTAAKLPSPAFTANRTPSVKEPSNSTSSYASITASHLDKPNSKFKDSLTKFLIDTIQKIASSTDIKETIMSAL